MAGKLKGFNIKRLFVDHGEKLAFVIVLGMVVAGLAGTNWVPYQKQPSEFTAKVDSAVKNIAATTWSQEEQEQFILQEEEAPHRIVDRGINDRIAVTPFYVQSQPQLKDKDARDDPLQEPQFLPVVQLMASDARVLVRQTPDLDDGLVAAVDGADRGVPDDDATGPGGFPSGAAEERPDEFLGGGRSGAGYGGSLIDDDGPGRGGSGPGFGRGAGRDYASMNAPELYRNSRAGRGGGSRSRGSARGRSRGRQPGNEEFRPVDDDGAGAGRRGRGSRRDRRRGSRTSDRNNSRSNYIADDDDGDGPWGGNAGYGPSATVTGPTIDGKGYPFVSVRGVFEFREQVRMYSDAIHKNYNEALQHFMIVDFKLERQRMLNGPDEWTDWEPVNDQVFRDILREAGAFDPEVVDPAVTDAAITCPLPPRLTGRYNKQATHPSLEEYTLDDEDVSKEVEYQELLLRNVLEQQKQVPEGLVVKKGFADMQFDQRSLQQAYFGGASSYGSFGGGNRVADDDEDGGYSGFGGRGSFGGGNRGRAAIRGGRGQQPQNEMLMKSIDDLAREWAEKGHELGSEETKEDLKEWIQARAAPQGDLLLFRYFDFDVEPGQTYRYRVQLELRNPNYGAPLAATGGVASVIDGATRWTPWSEPTEPTRVSETVQYFLTTVEPARSLAYPQARMNIFQYDLDVGTVVQDELDVAMGQNVGGKSRVEQADPAKGLVDDVDYTFKSNDVLIDVVPDVRFARNEHPDLQLPRDSRGLAQIAEIAAVVTPHGQIKTVDPMSQADALERAKRRKGWQDDLFSHLNYANDRGAGSGGNYGYQPDDDEQEDAFMNAIMGATSGRNNPLRRGGFGGRR